MLSAPGELDGHAEEAMRRFGATPPPEGAET
jgi:hypothetical protein